MNQQIFFQDTTPDDIPMILQMESDQDNSAFIFPNTEAQHLELIQDSDIKHCLIKTKEGLTVGFVIIAGLDNNNRSVEFRRIVIHQKGKGYGRLAIQEIKRLCFEELNCHRLWLDVLEINSRARNLYQSEGFKEEGMLRDGILKDDKFLNLIIMSMLENEYN